jgi:hypothetical protein
VYDVYWRRTGDCAGGGAGVGVMNSTILDSPDPTEQSVAERIKELGREITKAKKYLLKVKYSSQFRPSLFAISYAWAELEHARALVSLVKGGHWISTWPVARAQVEAMIWVHEFACFPLDTWVLAELASVNARLSWKNEAYENALKPQMEAWKTVLDHFEINPFSNTNTRLKALTTWGDNALRKKNEPGEFGWEKTWKMLSQASHMGGNQIGHLMMTKSAENVNIVITPGKPPELYIQEFIVSESLRTLGFTMMRLHAFLDEICEVKGSKVELKRAVVEQYKAIQKKYLEFQATTPDKPIHVGPLRSLESARGMLVGISTDVPREKDRV